MKMHSKGYRFNTVGEIQSESRKVFETISEKKRPSWLPKVAGTGVLQRKGNISKEISLKQGGIRYFSLNITAVWTLWYHLVYILALYLSSLSRSIMQSIIAESTYFLCRCKVYPTDRIVIALENIICIICDNTLLSTLKFCKFSTDSKPDLSPTLGQTTEDIFVINIHNYYICSKIKKIEWYRNDLCKSFWLEYVNTCYINSEFDEL